MAAKGIYDNFLTDLIYETAVNGITAWAGGGQITATQLTGQINRLTTVTSAGDSVRLPQALPGLDITIVNKGASDVQVFGLGADTIDGQGSTVGVSQMYNSVVLYFCSVAGIWETEGLAGGFGGPGLQTQSTQDLLTAKPGGTQLGGPTINRMLNRVTTVATLGDSVTLPLSARGLSITIVNAAALSMSVFPFTGDTINALGANAAFALPAGKPATFYCTSTGQWHAILSA